MNAISLWLGFAALLLLLAGCTNNYSYHATTNSNYQPNWQQVAETPGHQTNNGRSIWPVIRQNFALNHATNKAQVQHFIAYYQQHQHILRIILQRARPFLYLIVKQVHDRHLPSEIALLPILESGFDANAHSSAGALGLWQLMPSTASRFDVHTDNTWYHGRQSLAQSTAGALSYLTYLYNRFDRNWLLAVAAYNAGEGTVERAVQHNLAQNKSTDFWSLPLPTQTQNYVPRLLALAAIIAHPERYNIKLVDIPNRPLVATVLLPRQISLATAARFAGISLTQLKALNPAYTQTATPPADSGTYYLVLPIESVMRFSKNFSSVPTKQQMSFANYQVKPGDTLHDIAYHHATTVGQIKKINHLTDNLIRPKQTLIVPVNSKNAGHMVYHVQKGDTLSSIARQHNVTVAKLRRWNHLAKHAILHIDQAIIIK